MIFLIHQCRLMMVNARVATRLDSPTASSNRRRSSQLDQGARAAGRDRPRIPEPRNAEARGFAVQRLPPRQCPATVSPIRLDPPRGRERSREITGKPRNQRRCKGRGGRRRQFIGIPRNASSDNASPRFRGFTDDAVDRFRPPEGNFERDRRGLVNTRTRARPRNCRRKWPAGWRGRERGEEGSRD